MLLMAASGPGRLATAGACLLLAYGITSLSSASTSASTSTSTTNASGRRLLSALCFLQSKESEACGMASLSTATSTARSRSDRSFLSGDRFLNSEVSEEGGEENGQAESSGEGEGAEGSDQDVAAESESGQGEGETTHGEGEGEEGAEGETTHGEGEEQQEKRRLETAALIMIAVLVFATILFEYLKETIEERADRTMKPVIAALFGELTILGFLSACTFIVTKTNGLQTLSEELFHEEELLTETFETIHFALFFNMLYFVVQALLEVRQSTVTERIWEDYDQKSLLPPTKEDSMNLTLFRGLRREFILNRSVEPPFQPVEKSKRIPNDFPFGRYLSKCLGLNIAQVVHVNIITWALLLLVSLFFYVLAIISNHIVLAWTWVGLVWVKFFVTTYLQRWYVVRIEEGLAAPVSAFFGGNELPAWCNIDLEKYLSSRSWFKRTICKHTPTRQDALYVWSEGHERHHLLLVLQFRFVFMGIYLAVLVLDCSKIIYEHHGTAILVVYVVLSLIPVILMKMWSRDFAASISIVSSIASRHRNERVVAEVLREMKTRHIIRALVVIDKMHRFAKQEERNPGVHRELTREERDEVCKTFDAFDKDGDGSMSTHELARLLNGIGKPLPQKTLDSLVAALDKNNDGEMSKDEFIEWYSSHVAGHQENVSMEERAEAIFTIFDRDGDGEITIHEFKCTLESLSIGFTVDEVSQLILEFDEDGSMTVGKKEFIELIERYYPKELEGEGEARATSTQGSRKIDPQQEQEYGGSYEPVETFQDETMVPRNNGLGPGWEAATDPSTGKVNYYNRQSGVVHVVDV